MDSTCAHFVCDVKHVHWVNDVECTRIDSCRDEPTRVIPQPQNEFCNYCIKITHPDCIPLWICVAYHCLYAHYGGTSGRNYILQRHDGNVTQTHDHNMIHCTNSRDISIRALLRPSEYNFKLFHMLVGVVAISSQSMRRWCWQFVGVGGSIINNSCVFLSLEYSYGYW